MQQTARTPQAPGASTPQPFVVDVSDIPKTDVEVKALRIKMKDLQEELQDAASRRRTVASQLEDGRDAGLQARLNVLDDRIVQIEKDITQTGLLLKRAAPQALVAGTSQDPDPAEIMEQLGNKIIPIVAILSVFVFAPFAIAVSRFIWKRSTAAIRPARVDGTTQQKLDTLQQAVDTIAIEVERISEGQRFVTRLLSEKDRALGAGPAEPVRSQMKAAVPSERG